MRLPKNIVASVNYVAGAMLSSTVLFLGGSCCYIKKRPQRIEWRSSCCKRKEVRTVEFGGDASAKTEI